MGSWLRREVKQFRRHMLLQQLEERIVLDAAVDPVQQDNPAQTDQVAGQPAADQMDTTAAAATGSDSGGAAQAASNSDPLSQIYGQDLNVVLISNAIWDVEAISKAATSDATVMVYDAQHDNLATIGQKLGDLVASSGQHIDHLAILSHGESGVLKLGLTSVFTAESIQAGLGPWTALGTLLAEDARIDLYGCSIGEGAEGIALVQAIGQATGVTVWASDDMTGNISGADWDLEVKTAESSLTSLIDPSSADIAGFYLASAPIADSQTVTVNEDGTLTITVTGTDADDPDVSGVSFEVTNSVDHGTLTPLSSVVRTSAGHYSQQFRYTPTPDYNGADSFQFVLHTPNSVWQGFAPATNLGTEADSTYCVALGDVNNDGKLDVVTGNDGQPNRVYLGNGDGTFTLRGNVSADVMTTYSIALGDLNHDGYLDLVAGNFDGSSKIYQGIGNGSFFSRGTFGTGADDTMSLVLAYVDNDEILDIVAGNLSAPSKVYLGNGDCTFREGGTFGAADDGTSSVAVGDLNGDGKLDVVAGNMWTTNKVYLGNGDGTFVPKGSSGTNDTNTESVALGDVNGDGKLDLAVGTWGQTNKVYLGNGSGGFNLSATVGWDTTFSVALGDVNGDGNLDVITGNAYYRDLQGAVNKVYLGNGSGGFASYGDLGTDSDRTCSVKLGDLDGDGDLDVIAGNDNPPNGTNNRVYLNMGVDVVTDTSAHATVNIHVNGTPTDVSLSPTTMAENEPSGTAVGNFSTSDPDTGDTHTYALVPGDGSSDNPSFTIDGNQLKTAASVDYETKNSYSIRVRTTDAGGLSYDEVLTISVTNVNEAPVLYNLGGTMDYIDGDGARIIDSSITVTDVDSANMSSATITITGNYISSEDVLGIAEGDLVTGVSASWNASTGTLTLSGLATKAQYESMLEHVTYTNTSHDPNTADRTVTWTVKDAGNLNSASQPSTITVTANDPAVLADVGGTVAYTEGSLPTIIDNSVSISDTDGSTLASASIRITGNYQSGADRLGIDAVYWASGVTATWNAATGTLTLSGTASHAAYESMLEHVTYINTSDGPNIADRTVTWTVNDGREDSEPQTSAITVIGVNDAAGLGLNHDAGALDFTLDIDGKATLDFDGNSDVAYSVAVQADGKIVVAGYVTDTSSGFANYNFAVVRYNADGSLDTTFGVGGIATTDVTSGKSDMAYSVAIDADGKIVVVGLTSTGSNVDFALVRYDADGRLDTTFGSGGIVTTDMGSDDRAFSVAIDANGKIVVAGYTNASSSYDFAVVRYNSNGSLDTTFDTDGVAITGWGNNEYARSVAIQADGKIVAAGYRDAGGTYDFALVRYNIDGSLDKGFDTDGILVPNTSGNDVARSVVIQSDGKIVAAGYANNGSNNDFAVVRFNVDGTLDTGFDGDGRATIGWGNNDEAYSVAIQPDGKIVVAGFAYYGSTEDFAVVRYNADGTLDTTFGGGDGMLRTDFGGADRANAVAIQSDGKIVLAGYQYQSSNYDFAIARYDASRLEYAEGDGARVIDGSLCLSDPDSANTAWATIQITGNYVSAQDALGIEGGYTLPDGVSASWNSSTGTLSVTGTASVADYQAILRHVTYLNGSDAPSTAIRTVTWTVNDGELNSVAQSSTITVEAWVLESESTGWATDYWRHADGAGGYDVLFAYNTETGQYYQHEGPSTSPYGTASTTWYAIGDPGIVPAGALLDGNVHALKADGSLTFQFDSVQHREYYTSTLLGQFYYDFDHGAADGLWYQKVGAGATDWAQSGETAQVWFQYGPDPNHWNLGNGFEYEYSTYYATSYWRDPDGSGGYDALFAYAPGIGQWYQYEGSSGSPYGVDSHQWYTLGAAGANYGLLDAGTHQVAPGLTYSYDGIQHRAYWTSDLLGQFYYDYDHAVGDGLWYQYQSGSATWLSATETEQVWFQYGPDPNHWTLGSGYEYEYSTYYSTSYWRNPIGGPTYTVLYAQNASTGQWYEQTTPTTSWCGDGGCWVAIASRPTAIG